MRSRFVSSADIDALLSSGEFDPAWYLDTYPDVRELGMAPAEHYLWIGQRMGRLGRGEPVDGETAPVEGAGPARGQAGFESFGIVRHYPIISMVIVSFNSGRDLAALLPTLAAQTYRWLELIVIENGTENTEPLCRQYFPDVIYRREDNIGFAEANNLACDLAAGEFIALVNPDTMLEPTTLQSLLDGMRLDASAAVCVPKINFFTKFVRVTITGNEPFSTSASALVEGLSYRKLFVRTGSRDGDDLMSNSDGVFEVDLPVTGDREIVLRLDGGAGLTQCQIDIGYAKRTFGRASVPGRIDAKLTFDAASCSSARYLINNAGSGVRDDGTPYDRGFAEYDDGRFFSKTYVQALCGCVALIRRAAILDRTLFVGAFFAYYEDSELSYWLTSRGYRILYQPAAVVYHRHSESTEESSPLWNALVGRSARLYRILTGADPSPLNEFQTRFVPGFRGQVRDRLEMFDETIRDLGTPEALSRRPRKLACVYNSYFSSMGGGEKHALDVAVMLARDYEVYIASESDFDLDEIARYFKVDLSGIRKIISTAIDGYFTSKFDVFVNSTFRSNLLPAAKKNYYIVSFPHEDVNSAILPLYHFLHNSPFTARWAHEYWGEHKSSILLPIIGHEAGQSEANPFGPRRKVILSVGRFTYDGHCKNHHLILAAFRAAMDANPDLADWECLVIGSCDLLQPNALRYLNDLNKLADGYNVRIMENAPRDVLKTAYDEAAIYVHATGLNVDPAEPQRHEHFGITPFEAMLHGCAPVVYAVGGPSEQVEGLAEARRFADQAELVTELVQAMRDSDCGEHSAERIRSFALAMQAGALAEMALLQSNMLALHD